MPGSDSSMRFDQRLFTFTITCDLNDAIKPSMKLSRSINLKLIEIGNKQGSLFN